MTLNTLIVCVSLGFLNGISKLMFSPLSFFWCELYSNPFRWTTCIPSVWILGGKGLLKQRIGSLRHSIQSELEIISLYSTVLHLFLFSSIYCILTLYPYDPPAFTQLCSNSSRKWSSFGGICHCVSSLSRVETAAMLCNPSLRHLNK